MKKLFVFLNVIAVVFTVSGEKEKLIEKIDDMSSLTKRAEAGDPIAQHELGMLYMAGEGIQKDEKRPLNYFKSQHYKKM